MNPEVISDVVYVPRFGYFVVKSVCGMKIKSEQAVHTLKESDYNVYLTPPPSKLRVDQISFIKLPTDITPIRLMSLLGGCGETLTPQT